MKQTVSSLFILFSLFLPLSALGGESVEEVLHGLQRKVDSLADWRADFTQDAYVASVGQSDSSTGSVQIKKPGKVHWEYKEPERQLLVSDGKKLYFYSEEERQVIVNDVDADSFAAGNLLFLTGEKKIAELFEVRLDEGKPASEKSVRLDLTPKTPQPNLSHLILEVEKESYRILSLRTFDPYQNHTFVRFSNARENSGLPDSLFHFQAPKGTEVINASRMLKE